MTVSKEFFLILLVVLIVFIKNYECFTFNTNNETVTIINKNKLIIDNKLEIINRSIDKNNGEEFCINNSCLPKCCPQNSILIENKTCHKSNISLSYFMDDVKSFILNSSSKHDDNKLKNNFKILEGFPLCSSDKYTLDPDENDEHFKILNTGSLLELKANNINNSSYYCLEYFKSNNLKLLAIVCFPPIKKSIKFTYYPIGMLLSAAFLIPTFLVYAVITELRNLHGFCLMCHILSLAIGYFLLSVIALEEYSSLPDIFCVPLAYSVIFAFLSSFFWLNVMCFDIWWVFSGYRHPAASSKKEIERKKFRLYSIYSWGSPTIIFIILVIMDMEWVPKDYIRPELGVENCFFRTDKAKLVYFYLPLAFILSSNLIFFMMTTIKICKISKETKVLNHGESKRHQEHERQRFLLYVKLFIVMGMNWITELMSFFYPDLKNLWYITDASNTLQGVLIFVIFVWKRRILRLLKLRFCPNMKFLPNTGLSRTKSQSTRSSNMMTHQTSITSTMSENVRMKSISSQSSMLSINKSPM